MRKTLGYICLTLSITIALAIAILPFTGFSLGKMAAAATGIWIFTEVLFWVSVALLGKEAWERIKEKGMTVWTLGRKTAARQEE